MPLHFRSPLILVLACSLPNGDMCRGSSLHGSCALASSLLFTSSLPSRLRRLGWHVSRHNGIAHATEMSTVWKCASVRGYGKVSVSALRGSGARLETSLTPACPDRHGLKSMEMITVGDIKHQQVVSSPRWSLHDRACFSFLH